MLLFVIGALSAVAVLVAVALTREAKMETLQRKVRNCGQAVERSWRRWSGLRRD
jgi:hypothetical protein